MKKLEYKLLPCVFCTIGLNSYIVGHNLVHTTMQKLFNDAKYSKLKEQIHSKNTNIKTAATNTSVNSPLNPQ